MDITTGRTDLLPGSVPGIVVLLLAALMALLWLAARYLTHRHRTRLPWYGLVGPRILTAIAAAWCGFQVLGRWTELAGRWPIWLAALTAGLAIEGTAALYLRERKAITRRLGMVLTLLRSLAVLLILVMLMQPVWVWTSNRSIIRRVAVLLDDSESMHFVDRQWTVSERLEIAIHAGLVDRKKRLLPALDDLALLQARVRPWVNQALETNQAPPMLKKILADGAVQARELQAQADNLVGQLKEDEAPPARETLTRLQRQTSDSMAPAIVEALSASAGCKLSQGDLLKVGDAVEQAAAIEPAAREAADAVCWARLPEEHRKAIDAACATTRIALARDILTRRPFGGESLLDRLAARYDIDLMRLGNGVEKLHIDSARVLPSEAAGAASNAVARHDWTATLNAGDASPRTRQQAFRSLTDYPAALETILKEIPSEQLAGVLIVSDGRNNGESGIDPVGRRLGLQDVPVCGVVVGGSRLPLDVAIADVNAPESIFLGDKIRVRATIHITGARGRKINVLMNDATGAVDRVALDVSSDDFTREILLTHEPKEPGIHSYTLLADAIEGELFTANNNWKLDVAVSDDRTSVLLVDDRPRWEFRYLRNLFFGRDKSIHLQYLLLHPDNVAGVQTGEKLPPASAARKFGDAEAGALPVSRDEWRKFDVIILGDLDANTLTTEVVSNICHCVGERGAMLVVIAGPRQMPHGIADEKFQELLPVRYAPESSGYWTPPEERCRLALTSPGKNHSVMQQSASVSENEAVWNEMPDITWRFPVLDVKPGAEVLAYAQPPDAQQRDAGVIGVADAAAHLDAEMRKQARNALIVAQNYGHGKVLMLNFDQTWRLRYCVGDKFHHKFWGQVMRWGVGEHLRAGKEGLRLGTDELVYTPQHPARVLARVTDKESGSVSNAQLHAVITHGGKEVARVTPVYREGSQGLYEAALSPMSDPGRYDVTLTRTDGGGEEHVETAFLVVTAERPVELGDVTATRATLDTLSRWTHGRVVGPARANELWNAFGEGRQVVAERRERSLWDQPWLYLLIVGLLTAEWLLRKRGGLT